MSPSFLIVALIVFASLLLGPGEAVQLERRARTRRRPATVAATAPNLPLPTTANDLENHGRMRWEEEDDCDATVPCVTTSLSSSSSSSDWSDQSDRSVRHYLQQIMQGHAAETHSSSLSDSSADSHDTIHDAQLVDSGGHHPWVNIGDHGALPPDEEEHKELISHAKPSTSSPVKEVINLVTPLPSSEKPSTPVSNSHGVQPPAQRGTTPPWWPPTTVRAEAGLHSPFVQHGSVEDLFLQQRQREMDAQRASRLHLQIQRQLSLQRERQQQRIKREAEEEERANVALDNVRKPTSSSHQSTYSSPRSPTKLSASSDEIDVDKLLDEVFLDSPPLSSKLPLNEARETVEKKKQQLRHVSASAHSSEVAPAVAAPAVAASTVTAPASENEIEDRGQTAAAEALQSLGQRPDESANEDLRRHDPIHPLAKERLRIDKGKGEGQLRVTSKNRKRKGEPKETKRTNKEASAIEQREGTSQATAIVQEEEGGGEEGSKKAKRLKRPPPFWLHGVPDTDLGKLFKKYEDRYWAMEIEGEGVTGPFFKPPRYLSHADRILFRKWGRRFTEIVASRSKSRTEKNRQYRMRKWGPPGDETLITEEQKRTKQIAMLRKYLNERLHALLKGERKGWTTKNTEMMHRLAEMRPLQASDRTVELYKAYLSLNKGMKSCIDLPQE